MEKNTFLHDKKNMQNQPNQFQPINELSRFGHSVTLRKKKFFIRNIFI
jgi:hypothetical protein